jgi:hypothetical protein
MGADADSIRAEVALRAHAATLMALRGPCISIDELQALRDGLLPAGRRQAVHGHLEACGPCAQELSLLSANDEAPRDFSPALPELLRVVRRGIERLVDSLAGPDELALAPAMVREDPPAREALVAEERFAELFRAGDMLAAIEALDVVERAYERAGREVPWRVHARRALCLAVVHRHSEALEQIASSPAIGKRPDGTWVDLLAGQLLLGNDDVESAVPMLEKVTGKYRSQAAELLDRIRDAGRGGTGRDHPRGGELD